MKILIVSSFFGGTITAALNFIKDLSIELSQKGHLVSVALDSRYKSHYAIEGVEILWFDSIHFTNYSFSFSFLKIIKNLNPDIIHFHGYPSFQTDVGSYIASRRNIPYVLTPHGTLLGHFHLSSFFERIPFLIHEILNNKRSIKHSKFVIVTSTSEYNDAIRFGVEKYKIKQIPLCTNIPQNEIKTNNTKKILNLLFVGRIVPNKNLELILFALKKLVNRFPHLKLNIVGDEISGRAIGDSGYKNKIFNLITKLELSKNVKFFGWVSGKPLWELYANSEIFLCCSKYENFCLPLLEAAHFGLPIISTDVGIAFDLINKNKGGYILKKKSPEELALCISNLLEDNEKYQICKNFLYNQAKNYDISTITKNHEKLFSLILSLK